MATAQRLIASISDPIDTDEGAFHVGASSGHRRRRSPGLSSADAACWSTGRPTPPSWSPRPAARAPTASADRRNRAHRVRDPPNSGNCRVGEDRWRALGFLHVTNGHDCGSASRHHGGNRQGGAGAGKPSRRTVLHHHPSSEGVSNYDQLPGGPSPGPNGCTEGPMSAVTTARSLWNGRWLVHDRSASPERSFAADPADIDALPPAAQPLVRALLGAACPGPAAKARI